MARLTRAEQQARTRASVLDAARAEFVEHGYAAAKVDRIAERADLTRGGVYSNFPGKRALYLAVLVDLVERPEPARRLSAPDSVASALSAFARRWLERLPLVEEPAAGGRLQLRSLVGVVDDEHGRAVLAKLAQVEALLLAIGLESGEPAAPRRVRLAELVLTLLAGSGFQAELAPGTGDPFDRARACAHLADLDLADTWAPPYLAFVRPAHPCRDAWDPPTGLVDRISGAPADLGADGSITVLGALRLGAAEEAVRAAWPSDRVTIVLVTADAAETGALVDLRLGDLIACLRAVFPLSVWQHIRLVTSGGALVAAALGLSECDDETEAAVRIQDGMVVARGRGRGAAHAVAGSRRAEA
ncbi:TetR/AcrR family transcriptional regulator [Actinokineospora enzanensis]|uniref:TetR/AcrR family transcriptional regulator n=1 Tax=Actinokineospora enzanensis TaxID=155975 RepID=UPI000527F84A|nr:TetR/AcrR family transcriptional regulator [Actinokineospora enzanensis]